MANPDEVLFDIRTNLARQSIESAIECLSPYIDDEATKQAIDDLQFSIFDIASAVETAHKFKVFERSCANDND